MGTITEIFTLQVYVMSHIEVLMGMDPGIQTAGWKLRGGTFK